MGSERWVKIFCAYCHKKEAFIYNHVKDKKGHYKSFCFDCDRIAQIATDVVNQIMGDRDKKESVHGNARRRSDRSEQV